MSDDDEIAILDLGSVEIAVCRPRGQRDEATGERLSSRLGDFMRRHRLTRLLLDLRPGEYLEGEPGRLAYGSTKLASAIPTAYVAMIGRRGAPITVMLETALRGAGHETMCAEEETEAFKWFKARTVL